MQEPLDELVQHLHALGLPSAERRNQRDVLVSCPLPSKPDHGVVAWATLFPDGTAFRVYVYISQDDIQDESLISRAPESTLEPVSAQDVAAVAEFIRREMTRRANAVEDG